MVNWSLETILTCFGQHGITKTVSCSSTCRILHPNASIERPLADGLGDTLQLDVVAPFQIRVSRHSVVMCRLVQESPMGGTVWLGLPTLAVGSDTDA